MKNKKGIGLDRRAEKEGGERGRSVDGWKVCSEVRVPGFGRKIPAGTA